jgi:hypothetical protein
MATAPVPPLVPVEEYLNTSYASALAKNDPPLLAKSDSQ